MTKHYEILCSIEDPCDHVAYCIACVDVGISPYSFVSFVELFAWLGPLKNTFKDTPLQALMTKYQYLKPNLTIEEHDTVNESGVITSSCGSCGGGKTL